MRWDSLRLDSSDDRDPAGGTTLPLIERNAVARTFDTPEFRGMTFYEVQAKSIVSEVPKSSRMMFRYTINPYRGCQHSCLYCCTGETPILMADGTAKPLADVRVGDAIYGTVRDGLLPPLRHHRGPRPLVDGQARVPGHARGRDQADHERRSPVPDRARLEARHRRRAGPRPAPVPHHEQQAHGLRRVRGPAEGVGGLPARLPVRDDPRRRHAAAGTPIAPGTVIHHFRLALADDEALTRTRDYLGTFAVLTREFDFSAGDVDAATDAGDHAAVRGAPSMPSST